MGCQSFGIIDAGQEMTLGKKNKTIARAARLGFLILLALQNPDTALSFESLHTFSQSAPLNDWQTIVGQGFDTCEIPTLTQMQDWRGTSPYATVNLYIGGSARACGNAALTSAYLAQLQTQGWNFIPTWVGPQAACSGFASRMSSDATTAFSQGASEAYGAATAAADLSLLNGVVYYDLEAYDTGNSNCRSAADAFISGWTAGLKTFGHRTGVYGATCSSAVSDFWTLANVPDFLWAANWFLQNQYRADASVFGLSCLPDTMWSNHQRIRQYAGGHDESWGSTTLNIDSSVIDGVVATQSATCPDAGGVILYWNANYNCSNATADPGYRLRAIVSWQNVYEAQFNDKASSLRVPSGWSARVFVDADRAGASTCFNANVGNFAMQGNFPGTSTPINDSVSSIEVFNAPNCVNLFPLFLPFVSR